MCECMKSNTKNYLRTLSVFEVNAAVFCSWCHEAHLLHGKMF